MMRPTVIASDGHSFVATVRDLSADGFRLDLGDEELLKGERISLLVGKRTYEAEVKWVTGSEAGGVFLSHEQ